MSETPRARFQRQRRQQAWAGEFPHNWEDDASVSRRELLRLAVLTSGALFAGTLVLAVLGRIDDRRRGSPKAIAPLADVDAATSGNEPYYFRYPGKGDQAVLLRLENGERVAFSQKCTHLSCSVYYKPESRELICPCHDGKFDPATGEAVAGPPQRRLPRIQLEERDGMLFAIEEIP